jgi:flagellar motor switch protein FliN/FliY
MAEEEAKTPEEETEESVETAAAGDEAVAEPQTEDASPAEAGEDTSEAADAPQGEADDVTEVAEAELPQGVRPGPDVRGGQVDILLETTMPVEIRLGEVDLEVRDLLKVGPGSIVTVEKYVGEPLDLYLKGIRFATGQLVVANDMLGVRIIEILPRRKSDRVEGAPAAAAVSAAQQGAA